MALLSDEQDGGRKREKLRIPQWDGHCPCQFAGKGKQGKEKKETRIKGFFAFSAIPQKEIELLGEAGKQTDAHLTDPSTDRHTNGICPKNTTAFDRKIRPDDTI